MSDPTPNPTAPELDIEAEVQRRVAERLSAEATPPNQTRDGDGIVDLDALRAARAEKTGFRRFRLGGQVITLLPELPIDALEAVQRSDIKALIDALAPNTETAEYMAAQKLTLGDLIPILDEYGLNLGESLGSPSSSPSTPGR